MKIFIFIVFLIFISFSIFMKWSQKFSNPYQIEYFLGVRGSGKSTLATREAVLFSKKGHRIYANFELFGAYKIDTSDVGFYKLPPNSVLLLDEVSLIWSNRDFQSFPKEVEAFFRYVRKYKIYVRLYSQNFDVDKKVRGLVDSIYILVKLANVFTIAKKVKRTIVLHSSEKDENGQRSSEGFVSENYSYDLPTTWKVCFIPRWIKFFNSFEAPELPSKEYDRYIFIDEAYMYRLTHYWTYKTEQFKELKADVVKYYNIQKHAFRISFKTYLGTVSDI